MDGLRVAIDGSYYVECNAEDYKAGGKAVCLRGGLGIVSTRLHNKPSPAWTGGTHCIMDMGPKRRAMAAKHLQRSL